MSLELLPKDILKYILSFVICDPVSAHRCLYVNEQFKSAILDMYPKYRYPDDLPEWEKLCSPPIPFIVDKFKFSYYSILRNIRDFNEKFLGEYDGHFNIGYMENKKRFFYSENYEKENKKRIKY